MVGKKFLGGSTVKDLWTGASHADKGQRFGWLMPLLTERHFSRSLLPQGAEALLLRFPFGPACCERGGQEQLRGQDDQSMLGQRLAAGEENRMTGNDSRRRTILVYIAFAKVRYDGGLESSSVAT